MSGRAAPRHVGGHGVALDDPVGGVAPTAGLDQGEQHVLLWGSSLGDSVQPGSGTAFSLLPAENATGNYVKVVQRVPVKIIVDHWPDDVPVGPGMSVVPWTRVR